MNLFCDVVQFLIQFWCTWCEIVICERIDRDCYDWHCEVTSNCGGWADMGSLLVCLQFMTLLLLCLHVFTLHHFTVAQSLFLHAVMRTHICLPIACTFVLTLHVLTRPFVLAGNHPNEHIEMSHIGCSLQFSCVSLMDTSIDSCSGFC